MTKTHVSLYGDGQGHEYRSRHGDVRHRMHEIGEDVGVGVCGHEESSEHVGDASEDNKENVEAGESQEKLVEHVTELRPGEDDERKRVAHEAGRADDRDQDSVEPEPVVIVLEPVAAVSRPGAVEVRVVVDLAQLVDVGQVCVEFLHLARRGRHDQHFGVFRLLFFTKI